MRPLFEWFGQTAIANIISDSKFIFPIVETFHLLALTVLLGTILVMALRLIGVGLRKQPVPVVAGALAPLTNWSIVIMLVTGFLLFSSEAIKCYESPPFFFKMGMLAVSILFQLLVLRPVVRPEAQPGRPRAVITGILSVVCWFSVAVGGRAIGFY